jgi:hypothetical protein
VDMSKDLLIIAAVDAPDPSSAGSSAQTPETFRDLWDRCAAGRYGSRWHYARKHERFRTAERGVPHVQGGNQSDHLKTICFRTLLPGLFGEANPLVLVQSAQSSTLDRTDVDENVLAALIGSDEAKSFVRVEPLHRAFDGSATAGLRTISVVIVAADALAGIPRPGCLTSTTLGWGGTGLHAVDSRDLRSLWSVGQITHNDRSFVQALEAGLFYDRDMEEHIRRTIIRRDETEALG